MTDIHKGLAGSTFTKPKGIVEQSVCKSTGCSAIAGCPAYVEIFSEDNLPEKCEGKGGSQTICSESGKVATPYCSQYVATKVNTFGGVVPKEKLQLWKAVNGSNYTVKGKITDTCPIHTKPKEDEKEKEKTNTTPVNVTKPQTNNNKNNIIPNNTKKNNVNSNNKTNGTNITNTTNTINKNNSSPTSNTSSNHKKPQ